MSQPRSVLITGGGGFVGRHLVAELQREWKEVEITIWDRDKAKEQAGTQLVTVDITEPGTYIESLRSAQPDWIIHLAAIASVPMALEDPYYTHRVNVEATGMLLENMKQEVKSGRCFVTSTADLYGFGSPDPLPELPLEETKPQNPYAESKLEMEKLIEKYFDDVVLRVRPFPHIGPGQSLGFVTSDFASQIAAIEKGKQEPIIHVGNLDAQRDFTDVRDVVRAYRLLMEKGKLGEVYHVASGKAVKIADILTQMIELSSVDIEISFDEKRMRPSDNPIVVGDATKLRKLTGWEPTISLDQTLRDILEFWRSQH